MDVFTKLEEKTQAQFVSPQFAPKRMEGYRDVLHFFHLPAALFWILSSRVYIQGPVIDVRLASMDDEVDVENGEVMVSVYSPRSSVSEQA